jgi:hypothetical protein
VTDITLAVEFTDGVTICYPKQMDALDETLAYWGVLAGEADALYDSRIYAALCAMRISKGTHDPQNCD